MQVKAGSRRTKKVHFKNFTLTHARYELQSANRDLLSKNRDTKSRKSRQKTCKNIKMRYLLYVVSEVSGMYNMR